MKRNEFLAVLKAALAAEEGEFGLEASESWLAMWPGDLEAQLLRAKARLQTKNRTESALPGSLGDLRHEALVLVQRDPEWLEAWDHLARLERDRGIDTSSGTQSAGLARQCVAVLSHSLSPLAALPEWAALTRKGRLALQDGNLQEAGQALARTAALAPDLALPAVYNFRLARQTGSLRAAIALGEAYLAQWPHCLVFQLGLADLLNRAGRNDYDGADAAARASSLLHSAAAADLGGQVARRLWPSSARNAYARLWFSDMQLDLPRPAPAKVASFLGRNRLGGSEGSPTTQPTSPLRTVLGKLSGMRSRLWSRKAAPSARNARTEADTGAAGNRSAAPTYPLPAISPPAFSVPVPSPEQETLWEVRAELDQLTRRLGKPGSSAGKQPGTAKAPEVEEDSRTPAYIVLASRERLATKYGEEAAQSVLAAAEELAQAVAGHTGWKGYCIQVDSAGCLEPLGLKPVEAGSAWAVKLLLRDIDAALGLKNEMIGAVVILGGHDLIPFHLLPNPTDDVDDEVASDNPYGTRDENYFAPEWPVGRLPSPAGDDPIPLLRQIRTAIAAHPAAPREKSLGVLRYLPAILNWLRILLFGSGPGGTPDLSFGYTANVWKDASLAVFSMIGDPGDMLTSPPVDAARLPGISQTMRKLSYFNLHGIEDSAEWYGQRAPDGPITSLPEYPIALRPSDVVNSGRAPHIVFTEACYGANIHGKAIEEALCLKFLDSGSRAVVGSTKISYGSITTPLIGADLLGKLFWEYLAQDLPAGEALRRAKISLARILDRRQGYLDGEDQKTLISFVLYGDPMMPAPPALLGRNRKLKKGIYREKAHPAEAPLVCSRQAEGRDSQPAGPEVMEQVKSIVARYLPGMQGASYTVTHPHPECDGRDHNCPTAQFGVAGVKGVRPGAERNVVVTLSKVIQVRREAHPHFARLTMNPEGKVLKLAVSR